MDPLKPEAAQPFFTNDAVVLGLLLVLLAAVFVTSSSDNRFWKKFYTYCPSLLLCYFLPALLNWPLGLVSGDLSELYTMASRYLLPTCLVYLCLSIDAKGIINLGPKAIIMFFTATAGIILGGPIALFIVSLIAPSIISDAGVDDLWRGLSTIAGSWIGGGANQAAMKEVYNVSDKLFTSLIVVDVVIANFWMGFLLYGAGISEKMDRWLKADASAIEELKLKVEKYRTSIAKIPSTTDLFVLFAVGFGATALSHWGADVITPIMENHKDTLEAFNLTALNSSFFWIVVLATTAGFLLSFTKAKQLEGVGASNMGSVFIYVLVAAIGMKMNIAEVLKTPGLFLIGAIWMLVHITLLMIVAKLIKAPFFFVAVGSQANVGGAASAPVVASAFSPALAPVGVLLAVLGYAVGTYGAIISAQLMEAVSK